MKLYSLIFCLFILFSVNPLQAQDRGEIAVSKSPFIPYLVGGLNWASINGTQNNSAIGPFATFHAGIGVVTLINNPRPLSLAVEAFYSEQGFKFKEVSRNTNTEYMKFSYINIPAILRFNLSRSSNFYIGLGPQVAFLVDGKVIRKNGTKSEFGEDELSKNTFDIVGTFGKYFGNKADMGVELRYQGGLNEFMVNEPDYRHSVLQLRVIMPMFFL
jgi:hypothetical protein